TPIAPSRQLLRFLPDSVVSADTARAGSTVAVDGSGRRIPQTAHGGMRIAPGGQGDCRMQIGMIGLGRMGGNMVRRLLRGGHDCLVYDRNEASVAALAAEGATGCHSVDGFIAALTAPRVVWLMVPAAVVDVTIADLVPRLHAGDIVVDGGNSYYV